MVQTSTAMLRERRSEWRRPFFCIPSGFGDLSKSFYQYLENINDNIQLNEVEISSGCGCGWKTIFSKQLKNAPDHMKILQQCSRCCEGKI